MVSIAYWPAYWQVIVGGEMLVIDGADCRFDNCKLLIDNLIAR